MPDEAITIPVYQEYMNPILEALRLLGGTSSIKPLDDKVAELMNLIPEQLSISHGNDTHFENEPCHRMAWARTHLKKDGLITNPKRGVWALTERGASSGPIDEWELADRVRRGDGQKTEKIDENGSVTRGDSEESPEREVLLQEVTALYDRLFTEGKLLSRRELAVCYERFRAKFGPSILGSVDGEALLDMLHGRGNRDSLAYWLEFKDDDELPARFGSISGGSALKFGIYQAKETGHWMTGHPTHQKRLTTEEAVAKVRHQRDQLIAGCSVLEKYASNPDRADYQALQREMQAAAPDLAESAWGHKYFSMLYPMLLDDYHGAPWQQYHLTKLLAVPGAGRYENAKGFLDVARQLEIPINSLTETLNVRDGDPHAYWSVDADAVGEGSWEIMSKEGCVTLAWSATGDLSDIEYTQIGKDGLRERVMRHFALEDRSAGRIVNQLFKLAVVCSERDIVLATRGRDVIGIGRITGGYSFAGSGDPAAHRRPVEWISSQPWLLSFAEGSKQAFYKLGNFRNIVEVERQLLIEPVLQHAKSTVATPSVASEQRRLPPLEGVVGRAQQILERKRQMILFGPPGTGKTYWAERTIKELVARSWFRVSAGDLNREMIETLRERKATETCSFHAAYGYEDFLEGYRPTVRDGQLAFEPRDGIFKKLCARAAKDLEHQYFLLIDEINRGEIPRIFGELLTVLEFDRRGTEVTLPLSGSSFVVPQNVYIVGTMNTADRSVALVDAALRRRFGFIELMPDSSVLGTASVEGLPLGPWLDELNLRVLKHAGRDARNIQVGHSYLMQKGKPITDVNRFTEALRDDIVPLLQEYCYESYEALELILGPGLVDRERQRIRTELFEQNRRIDLVRTLLTSFDEITATAAAVAADTGDDAEDAGLDAAEDEANDL